MADMVVYSINGPVVKVRVAQGGTVTLALLDMVYVGSNRLIGEVIAVNDTEATIQVYEATTGLSPGEAVTSSGGPQKAMLGPGLLSNIFDGIQRPLRDMISTHGLFVAVGGHFSPLSPTALWQVTPLVSPGDQVTPGMVFATCPETALIEHRSLVPPGISGTVLQVAAAGRYTINDPIVIVRDTRQVEHQLSLAQQWPIRQSRPVRKRLPLSRPLITGLRVIDTLFPLAKGGTAAIPGGFGTGKTMTQHQLAKYCDADVIIYIGCGERGNEMTQVLQEFAELIDPHTQRPLTDRTLLIANTSNMPVAAREASIYTGITLAEYYRDMGYHVAMLADSTSRWAEALREISGRLEEMPAEEGFPAYLPSRIAQFYERAGEVTTLGGSTGSISIVGAVSPQGADFSEPVTQNTKRYVRCFWALDKELAYARHYPAINWTDSYSEYLEDLQRYYSRQVDRSFTECRNRLASILQEESRLMETVKLVGADVLPDDQRLVIEVARIIRVGFLQQNAFHPQDSFVPLTKQLKMMEVILLFDALARNAVRQRIPLSQIMKSGLPEQIIRMKYEIANDEPERFDTYLEDIRTFFTKLTLDSLP
ncbi:MAG: V-type ATP synthase subunit A [Symbiobacteriaceae bacterium]|nr:V-type ATP synthase subunit A [Symbiobacteriaceae bacterium]